MFRGILGERKDRDPNRARAVDNMYGGGVNFEQSDHAISLDGADRAYTLAQSYQVPRRIISPSVGAKVHGQVTKHHELRREIIMVIIFTSMLYILLKYG